MRAHKIISVNPGKNYAELGQIDISTRLEIDNKIVQARAAQPSWADFSVKKRCAILEKLYEQFVQKKDIIGSLITKEMGMPVSTRNRIDIDNGLHFMRGYLDSAEQWLAPEVTFENNTEIHYLFFEPRGVAGVCVPWNLPFSNFIWGVIQNLVVGNTVIFKHSEECPLTGKLLEDLVKAAGLPEGVFNEIYGEVSEGEYIMNSDIDLIYFVGRISVGKRLYQIAAKKCIPAILEVDGSAPGIVFADADLSLTAESIYFYRFANCGQMFDGLKRLIVEQSILDAVIERLKHILSTKKISNPEDPTADIGPLVADRIRATLEEQMTDAVRKGTRVIVGGQRPKGLLGAYYEPTILTNITSDMLVWHEEVFGPVLAIVAFNSEEEAISLANDTAFGLGAYIYTADRERALRVSSQLKTGNISVNGANYSIVQDPYGGYKESGIGRKQGKLGMREFCSKKVVALKK